MSFKVYVNEKARAGTDFFRTFGDEFDTKQKALTYARREYAGRDWVITEERVWTTSKQDAPKAAKAKEYQKAYRAKRAATAAPVTA